MLSLGSSRERLDDAKEAMMWWPEAELMLVRPPTAEESL